MGTGTTGTAPDKGLAYGGPAARWVLVATVLGSSLTFVDATVVNIAMPVIGKDLDAGLSALTWTVNAYTLTLACFILLGGPFIESTHGNLKFTAPLTGITAAVVGVIVNLAVFFAYHVLWPRGLAGPFDDQSALIGVAAAVALFRFKVGVIPVVVASGLAGLAVRLLF